MAPRPRIVSILAATLAVALWPLLAAAEASAEEAAAGDGGYGPLIGAVAGILFGSWLAVIRIRGHKNKD